MAASKSTTSRGLAISYEDEGSGYPVVMVPGFMQSATDYREAGYVDRLADRWRVLVVDPLGHGKSAKPHDPEPYRSPGVAADVISVLDAEALEKAVLWGYSRGAWLAMMAAIEFPERLSGVIVGGGSFVDPPPTQLPSWVEPLSRGDWAGFWELFPIPLDDETRRQFERNDPEALAAERIGRIASPYAFDLTRVKAPAMIYCGSEDGPEDCERDARLLHTDVGIVERRDHQGAFEDVDQVMELAAPFLESISSREPITS